MRAEHPHQQTCVGFNIHPFVEDISLDNLTRLGKSISSYNMRCFCEKGVA